MNSLRIAMLCPIKRPITSDTTVSRNRVIVDLSSELIKRRHRITLIGTADSILPQADIEGVVPKALNFIPAAENPFYQHTAYLTMMIETLVNKQDQFDIVHNHMYPEFLPLLSLASFSIPMLTTVHAQMTAELKGALEKFPHALLVAISESAKKAAGLPMDVVHNSVDTDFFVPSDTGKKDYLLFVGRMSKARSENGKFLDPKGAGNAIALAEATGERLKIVGNVEDPAFYDEIVKPHLSDKIEFVGEVSAEQTLTREQMRELFQNAKVLINAINWEEPFGLVMAEALSCGTPVIAYNRGAVSEIVVDGLTGYVIDPHSGLRGLVEAFSKIKTIDRITCRKEAVDKFSKKRMVDDYEKLYYKLIAK